MHSSSVKVKIESKEFQCVLDNNEVHLLETALYVFKTTKKYNNLCPSQKEVIKNLLNEIELFYFPF